MIQPIQRTKPLYEQIADDVQGMIDGGTLRPGDRAPSIRRLSQQREVSVSTIIQAYLTLEDRGLVEARPQSGFYVRAHGRNLPPEPTASEPVDRAHPVGISDLIARVLGAARRPEIVPLGAAVPDIALVGSEKLCRIMSAVIRDQGPRITEYEFGPGNLELRRQVARRAMDSGCQLGPEQLVVTTGSTEALHLCLRSVAGPGDTIAVESPTYYGFLQMIENFGMRAVEIATHPRDGIQLNSLSDAIRRHRIKACLLVSNYSNPLGSTLPAEARTELVSLLARKGIPLIEDDIYGDLHFDAERLHTCKSHDTKGNVLLCSSFSKTLAPGLRVGWCAAGKYQDRVLQLKTTTTMAGSTPGQRAIAEYLRTGGYDHLLRRLRRSFESQTHQMSQFIGTHWPRGTRVSRPRGGFVLWVELPGKVDSLALHQKALAAGISIAPGPLFTAGKQYRNCIRLNCGHPWSPRIEKAVATLGQLIGGEV